MQKFITFLVLLTGLVTGAPHFVKAASVMETTATGEQAAAPSKSPLVNRLVSLNRRDIERLFNRHLSLLERISLKIMRHRLKKELSKADKSVLLNSYIDSEKGTKTRVILIILLVLLIILFLILVSSALKGF